ncbi:MAG: GcvT family protein [Myxococcales bacterium]|nr:GcvT family protein [Myxococcales bacterium]
MGQDNPEANASHSLPSHARVVIIGGGVIGCSVAYHLTKLGWRDVVLLERAKLTSGTTWHAAGLVVTGTFDSELTVTMSKYSRDLYKRLGQETGQDTGFRDVGYLQIASNTERVDKLRRVADFCRGFGIEVEEVSTADVKKMWPLFETDDILCGFYTPDDGRANPVDVTISLAKGARMGGAQIFEDTPVTAIHQKNGRVTGVATEHGDITAEYVVNCGGMWARQLGKMAGVNVPLHAAEHYYLITEEMKGIHRDLPIVEDPDLYTYFREEGGGLMLGMFEPIAGPWGMEGIPKDFTFADLPPDWDRLAPYIDAAMDRIPAARDVGVRQLFCGPESFTPDMGSLLGESPELQNFYVAAGFNSLGILFGGGAGQVLAQWIVDGLPPVDVCEVNIDRMHPFQNTSKYLHDRVVEMIGWQYISWPNLEPETSRNARKSAIHDRLAAEGAYFSTSGGWEFPSWFAPEGVEPKLEYSWGRQNWAPYSAAEHKAAREGVVLMDLTHMSKFLVQGRDAEKVLNRICANNVAVPVGRIVYTQFLNERGRIEADLTVTRTGEFEYLLIAGDLLHMHALTWLRRNIPEEAHAFVTDISSAYNILNIQGPRSRELLGMITDADLSTEAFPYPSMQEIEIGYAMVKAMRITYVGELGYELYVPTEQTLHVFDLLMEAGKKVGLKHAGLAALETLRLEKAYRDWAADIDNEDTPLEVGLGFAVSWDKPGGFIGREALLKQKDAGLPKTRLVQFLLEDPEPVMHHNETIFRDGVRVGYIKAGGYGHTLGGAVGLGPVANEAGVSIDFIKSGHYEIEVSGTRYPAKPSLRPMYDPKGVRIRT